MSDKIIQITSCGVQNTFNTQCDYLIFALTESGKVLASTGDCQWCDISPKERHENQLKEQGDV